MVEEAPADATAAHLWVHRNAKFGQGAVTLEGQVGHGHQHQLVVEDAEDLVAAKVQVLDVAADLLVAGDMAEAQVAILLAQGQQMLQHTGPVVHGQRAHRQPAPGLGGRRGVVGQCGFEDFCLRVQDGSPQDDDPS